jgi:hypothetical protein
VVCHKAMRLPKPLSFYQHWSHALIVAVKMVTPLKGSSQVAIIIFDGLETSVHFLYSDVAPVNLFFSRSKIR